MDYIEQIDQLTDRIIDMLNENYNLSPVQIFASQMLALKCFMRTAVMIDKPQKFSEVERIINECLAELIIVSR